MTNISCLKGWKFIDRHRIEFIHALSCQNMYTRTYNILARMRHGNNSFFWEKSICCQHATRRTTNEIWITIMIIAWWYSNKFLSLPIILFSFYSIFLLAFLYLHAVIICLQVIPWVLFHFIYLSSSVSMRWLFACRIWIAWVFLSCRVDIDNPYVLVVYKRHR